MADCLSTNRRVERENKFSDDEKQVTKENIEPFILQRSYASTLAYFLRMPDHSSRFLLPVPFSDISPFITEVETKWPRVWLGPLPRILPRTEGEGVCPVS